MEGGTDEVRKKAAVIAVCNQKGGVAKTTTVENLGIGLAREGKRVLLVDNDPQASLTIALGHPNPDDLPFTLTEMMNLTMDETLSDPVAGILRHEEGVDLIPANISLAGLEVSLVNTMNRERILKHYYFSPGVMEEEIKCPAITSAAY